VSPEFAAADKAFSLVSAGKRRTSAVKSPQVRNTDEIDYLMSLCHAWHRTFRPEIEEAVADKSLLAKVDDSFAKITRATARSSSRNTYVSALEEAKNALAEIRTATLGVRPKRLSSADVAPNFMALAPSDQMQAILQKRWNECQKCISAEAYLAATVMMGGFLETLFLAKVNQLQDKKLIFTASKAPKDQAKGSTLPLWQWTLRDYIEVAGEVGWISKPGKDVASVLRDYRNYIHPEKELSHGVSINVDDVGLFWDLTKRITFQLIK